MKNLFKLLGILFLMSAISCVTTLPQPIKPDTSSKRGATVIKDCTGTYVKFDNNNADYLVCNSSILNSFQNGARVSVYYRGVGKCSTTIEPKCKMYHENKGSVEILSVE